jgi:uncharacterized protein
MITGMDARIDPRTGLEELERDECLDLVARAPIGRLGVIVAGRPLIFPVNFAMDGSAIVIRTDTGTKLYGARNAPVVFECDGIDTAYHTGWSVLVHGEVEEVHNPIDLARLAQLPLGPWLPGPKATWLRLRTNFVTGRRIPPHGGRHTPEGSE